MSYSYNFVNCNRTSVSDDTIVISASDESVFMQRIARMTKTMDMLYQQAGGVLIDNIRYVSKNIYAFDVYENDQYIASFSWLKLYNPEYFIGISIVYDAIFSESLFVVDSSDPIKSYIDNLIAVKAYDFKDLIGEILDFVNDYGMITEE